MLIYNSRKHILNENFFKIIDTEEKAYILGLLLSDGYVSSKDYLVGYTSIDYELLDIIKTSINATNPINKRNFKTGKPYYEISLNSKELFNGLMIHRQNLLKKDIKHIPTDISNHLIHHFIRGYFDSDGCIRLKNNNKQLNFDIASYYNILLEISKYIDKGINKRNNTSITKHGNIYRITYAGNKQCNKIYRYIYKDATLFLNRKYEIFKSNLKEWSIIDE